MYQSFLNFLESYSAADLVVFVVALVAGIAWVYPRLLSGVKSIVTYFKNFFEEQQQRQANIEQLHKNTNDIQKMKIESEKAHLAIIQKSNEKDQEILESIQEIRASIEALNNNFESYKESQREIKEKEEIEKREDLRAELVDKYLIHKERGSITDMELDSFLSKEERYESYHGNSYVHDTIKPFILTLPVTNEIKTE